MQGLYYRRNDKTPWRLVRQTRSVGDAHALAERVARLHRAGRLLYLESETLPDDVWDMRTMQRPRYFKRWLAKELLETHRKIVKGGRATWEIASPKQLKLFP